MMKERKVKASYKKVGNLCMVMIYDWKSMKDLNHFKVLTKRLWTGFGYSCEEYKALLIFRAL